jgi:uncharacterized protein YaaQ
MNASQEEHFHPTQCLWVIIQAQDAENAENALTAIGVSATRLPSFGGFLGRRNATLLVALEEGQKEAAFDILQKNLPPTNRIHRCSAGKCAPAAADTNPNHHWGSDDLHIRHRNTLRSYSHETDCCHCKGC